MTTVAEPADTVRRALYEVIGRILPGTAHTDIRGDRHLRDLGADSIDRVEIIMAVLDRFAITEPMARFSSVPDIDGLVAIIVELQETQDG